MMMVVLVWLMDTDVVCHTPSQRSSGVAAVSVEIGQGQVHGAGVPLRQVLGHPNCLLDGE